MKKFENFCKTLDNLEEINRIKPPYNVVITAGLCSLFTQCFEQSWRAMKEYLSQEGWAEENTGSPRQILKISYQTGLIQDESGWLKALEERNLGAHTYNQEVADTLIADTRSLFLLLFRALKKELEKRYEG